MCRYVEIIFVLSRLLDRLAIGHFGDIHKGDWYGPSNFRKKVAMKMLNQGAVKADRLRMLQEVAMMAQFRHPNLIALYGISNRATSQVWNDGKKGGGGRVIYFF